MIAWLRPRRRRQVLETAGAIAAAIVIATGLMVMAYQWQAHRNKPDAGANVTPGGASASTPARFNDDFKTRASLQESGNMQQSASSSWWLNSGGTLTTNDGYAQTVHGSLPPGEKWRKEYAKNNPVDTDGGTHPQNVFRLVTRAKFRQVTQEVEFRIDADQLSKSPRRNESNGLLLFNRYQDGDDLYYTGLRVDGHAVIKKKIHGKYYTMAETPVYPGSYDRTKSPNLLPKNVWIRLRSSVITRADGMTEVEIWSDLGRPGEWRQLMAATDDGRRYGGEAINAGGYGGIRTDFMDVSFRNYSIAERPN